MQFFSSSQNYPFFLLERSGRAAFERNLKFAKTAASESPHWISICQDLTLEQGFESTVESFKGIVCPGEVVNGPEKNVPHLYVESRFPSRRVSRFFAYKSVLKIIFDVVRNVAIY